MSNPSLFSKIPLFGNAIDSGLDYVPGTSVVKRTLDYVPGTNLAKGALDLGNRATKGAVTGTINGLVGKGGSVKRKHRTKRNSMRHRSHRTKRNSMRHRSHRTKRNSMRHRNHRTKKTRRYYK
jgi:hypothetical protein